MQFLSGVRAILFDLDGTLVDTAPDITAAVGATLHQLDRPPLDDAIVRSYIGRGVDVLLHRVLTGARDGNAALDVHRHAREVFLDHYGAHNGRTARVYDGVREGLAHAKRLGLALCCVTNKPQAFSDALLAQVGLDRYFEFAQGGDALPKGKPDPAPLLHAAARLGVAPASCLMVGDSSNDAIAARAAGMPVVLVGYGYTEDQPVDTIDCDAVVASIADLVMAIDPAINPISAPETSTRA
ncbi:MAG TPA: phosphoglycolate phosphatase [Rhodanobacteraceae bacterium]|jgi:phosphoglycolate phosphatase|nr:phosphoglycolate phosphatase [Rhodanobacteraceae bacterium]